MIQPTVAFIEKLASQLSAEDQLTLIDRLSRQSKSALPRSNSIPKEPLSLRGMWRDKFPKDFDIEAAVREIRSEWRIGLDEMEEA